MAHTIPSSLFGTDGIRAKTLTFPLTPREIMKIGQSIALWHKETCSLPSCTIFCAYDGRFFSHSIFIWLSEGFSSVQKAIFKHCGLFPTPFLAYGVQNFTCCLGIMITASHNQYRDNGIKIFTPKGKISEEEEKHISTYFFKKLSLRKKIVKKEVIFFAEKVVELYTKKLKEEFQPNFLQDKKIIVDTANGALSLLASPIFSSFGAHVIPLHITPNGYNINKNAGSVYPQEACIQVIKQKAFMGCAFDGDGDRIVLIRENGTLMGGDLMLAILSTHPEFMKQKKVVGTIMSSKALESFLSSQGKQLLRTPVGDKHVASTLSSQDLCLGGEPSGHIIISSHLQTADGIYTALKTLESLLLYKGHEVETKFPHKYRKEGALRLKENKKISSEILSNMIRKYEGPLSERLVVVRYSGTEPVLRIMVEDSSTDIAHTVYHLIIKELETYA